MQIAGKVSNLSTDAQMCGEFSTFEERDAVIAAIHIDAAMFDLPDVPEIPEPALRGDQPTPLVDSRWDFREQCRRLIESKQYTNGNE